jgi:ribonuclease P protein component
MFSAGDGKKDEKSLPSRSTGSSSHRERSHGSKNETSQLLRSSDRKVFEGQLVKVVWHKITAAERKRNLVIISKKAVPLAVRRNKIRRWIKEILRSNADILPSGGYFVFHVRPERQKMAYDSYRQDLLKCFGSTKL